MEEKCVGIMQLSQSRREYLSILGGGGATALAGCLGGFTEDETEAVELGILSDLSGELGRIGRNLRDAKILGLEQFQDSDREIEVSYRVEDTVGQVDTGVNRARAIADDGFPAIIGPMTSRVAIEVVPNVIVPEQVVGCSPTVTTPELTNVDDEGLMYRTAPSDAFQGAVQAELVDERLASDTAATLFTNDAYGRALADEFTSRFGLRGGEVTAEVPFKPTEADYSEELDEALAGDPDVLTIVGFTESAITILNNYYAEYDDHDIVVPDGVRSPDMMGNVNNSDLNNVIGTSPKAGGPNQEAFANRYRKRFGIEPTIYTSNAYDAAIVLALASLASDGTAEGISDHIRDVANPAGEPIGPDSVVEGAERVLAGEQIQYFGASSTVEFDRNGDTSEAVYEIWEFDPPDSFRTLDTRTLSK